jgi:hypothetical protein
LSGVNGFYKLKGIEEKYTKEQEIIVFNDVKCSSVEWKLQ